MAGIACKVLIDRLSRTRGTLECLLGTVALVAPENLPGGTVEFESALDEIDHVASALADLIVEEGLKSDVASRHEKPGAVVADFVADRER